MAERDLENAGGYIAFQLRNLIAAENRIKGIRKQINRLQSVPKRYKLDDDPILANLGIRKMYYKDYKMFFYR